MKELCSKFLSLLRYVPYIIEEKPKVQRFLSCLPAAFKDKIVTIPKKMRHNFFFLFNYFNKNITWPKFKGHLEPIPRLDGTRWYMKGFSTIEPKT